MPPLIPILRPLPGADRAPAPVPPRSPHPRHGRPVGSQAYQWFALFKQCFDATLSPFKYRLCPFDTITQDGRRLGQYAGWKRQQPVLASGAAPAADELWMTFEDGEPCNGTPRRASVRFLCGGADKLETMSEPSMCVYEGTFVTPSACSTDTLRSQHEELAAAAAAAGLPYTPSATLRSLLSL